MNKSKYRLQLTAGIITIIMAVGSIVIGVLIALAGTVMSWMIFGIVDAIAGSTITEMGMLIFIGIGVIAVLIIGTPLFVCGVLLCRSPQSKDGTVSEQKGRGIISAMVLGFYLVVLFSAASSVPWVLLLAILPAVAFTCLIVSMTKRHTKPVAASVQSGGSDTIVQTAEEPAAITEVSSDNNAVSSENTGPEIK